MATQQRRSKYDVSVKTLYCYATKCCGLSVKCSRRIIALTGIIVIVNYRYSITNTRDYRIMLTRNKQLRFFVMRIYFISKIVDFEVRSIAAIT